MKGQITPEQRGRFIVMHNHEIVQDPLNYLRMVRRLKVVPAPGQKVTARYGKREYIVGPRGNFIRQEGTHA